MHLLQAELESVGISPAEVKDILVLRQKAVHTVYRLVCSRGCFVLKWFATPHAVELQTYALLEKLGVPTLPVYGRPDQALLMEDLGSSAQWRLATEADVEQAVTGQAVADWYRQLHSAGQKWSDDCFSTGAAYSDWRNVTCSLRGAAREAFAQAYGPVNAAEKRLDDPLSILQGLVIAVRRIHTPAWAAPLLKSIENGELAGYVTAALE